MGGRPEGHMHTTVKRREPGNRADSTAADPQHCFQWANQRSALSTGGHGCREMSCEKAIWSDLHHGVGGNNRGTSFLSPVASFLAIDPLKVSVVLHLPAGGQQNPTLWPPHMPILMLCMIWKIAGRGKKTDGSDTRQLNAGNPTHSAPHFC